MSLFSVIFHPDAEREYVKILEDHPDIAGFAAQCVQDLIDFPPEKWVDVHRARLENVFKSDSHLVFDIQGEVDEARKKVVITRFRTRRKRPKLNWK